MKLLPYRHKFCAYHTTMHQFTVALYSKPQTCVFSCNLLPAILAEWLGSFTRYYGDGGKEKKVLPLLLPGLEPEAFRSRVRRSTTVLSPLPALSCLACSTRSGVTLVGSLGALRKEPVLHQFHIKSTFWISGFYLDLFYTSNKTRFDSAIKPLKGTRAKMTHLPKLSYLSVVACTNIIMNMH